MESVFLYVYMSVIPLVTAGLAAVLMRTAVLREMRLMYGSKVNLEVADEDVIFPIGSSDNQSDDTEAAFVCGEVEHYIRTSEEIKQREQIEKDRQSAKLCAAFTEMKRRYALTDRETEILRELFAGNGNRAIAAKLFISENTVKTHIHNLLQKTESASRAEAIGKLRSAMTETGKLSA